MCTAQATAGLYRIPESENKNPILCQYTPLPGCPALHPQAFNFLTVLFHVQPSFPPHICCRPTTQTTAAAEERWPQMLTNTILIDSKMTSSELNC
jgi:hypothetical protein